MVFVNEPENERTIDHERGAYLVFEGGAPEQLEVFSFYWAGEKMELYARCQTSNTESRGSEEKSDYFWEFFQIGIPFHMQPQKSEIIKMIEEAFKVYGSDYSHKFVRNIQAKYIGL